MIIPFIMHLRTLFLIEFIRKFLFLLSIRAPFKPLNFTSASSRAWSLTCFSSWWAGLTNIFSGLFCTGRSSGGLSWTSGWRSCWGGWGLWGFCWGSDWFICEIWGSSYSSNAVLFSGLVCLEGLFFVLMTTTAGLLDFPAQAPIRRCFGGYGFYKYGKYRIRKFYIWPV